MMLHYNMKPIPSLLKTTFTKKKKQKNPLSQNRPSTGRSKGKTKPVPPYRNILRAHHRNPLPQNTEIYQDPKSAFDVEHLRGGFKELMLTNKFKSSGRRSEPQGKLIVGAAARVRLCSLHPSCKNLEAWQLLVNHLYIFIG